MDRKEVEALLNLANLAGPMRRECRECAVPAETLAAMCRTQLAVEDAPVGTVTNFAPPGAPGSWVIAKSDTSGIYPKLTGQCVRLVKEPPQ